MVLMSGYSTQESLDQGVGKLKTIYDSFHQVGIKDRSMIWNSYVVLSVSVLQHFC